MGRASFGWVGRNTAYQHFFKVGLSLSPQVIHYCPFQCGSFVVVLCCLFLCQCFGDVSSHVCNTFRSVWVAELPPFGKELPTLLAVYSHVFCLFVIVVISHFDFEGGVRFFIAPVPVYCV